MHQETTKGYENGGINVQFLKAENKFKFEAVEKQTLCRRDYHRLKHSYHQYDLLTYTAQWLLKGLKSERNKCTNRWVLFG